MRSITKITFCALAALGCGSAAAERLLPDHLRLAIDTPLAAQAGAAHWLTALAPDQAPAAYLQAQAAAGPAEADGTPAALAAELISALGALGPVGVSMADYLALALPVAWPGDSSSAPPADAARPRGSPAAALPLLNFLPKDSGATPARPDTATRQRWLLPSALTDPLTRYLFAAAAVALVAGAGLRLARLTRHSPAASLIRL